MSVVHGGYFPCLAVVGSRKLRTGEPMDKDLLEFLQSFREETTRRFDEIGQEFDVAVRLAKRRNRGFLP